MSEENQEVLDLLREFREMHLRDIAEALGKPLPVVKQRLYRLRLAGKVERVGRGVYRLKEQGELPALPELPGYFVTNGGEEPKNPTTNGNGDSPPESNKVTEVTEVTEVTPIPPSPQRDDDPDPPPRPTTLAQGNAGNASPDPPLTASEVRRVIGEIFRQVGEALARDDGGGEDGGRPPP